MKKDLINPDILHKDIRDIPIPFNLWTEFKNFAFKGNLIDLALAVVLGGAFSAVINSLVKNVVMPVLSYVLPEDQSYRNWTLGKVEVGAFLGELVNFLIIALALFIVMVKVLGAMRKSAPPPVTTRECPFCISAIPLKATRCAHCTSEVAPVQT